MSNLSNKSSELGSTQSVAFCFCALFEVCLGSWVCTEPARVPGRVARPDAGGPYELSSSSVSGISTGGARGGDRPIVLANSFSAASVPGPRRVTFPPALGTGPASSAGK